MEGGHSANIAYKCIEQSILSVAPTFLREFKSQDTFILVEQLNRVWSSLNRMIEHLMEVTLTEASRFQAEKSDCDKSMSTHATVVNDLIKQERNKVTKVYQGCCRVEETTEVLVTCRCITLAEFVKKNPAVVLQYLLMWGPNRV